MKQALRFITVVQLRACQRSMGDGSALLDHLCSDSEHQLDFTDTANFLHQIASLTNTMLKGPPTLDEDIWSTQAMTCWNRSMHALREVFRTRCQRYIEHDEISNVSSLRIPKLKGEEPIDKACRVGRDIQEYAKKLQHHLERVHTWHEANTLHCSCCRCDILQGLQVSTIRQLIVLQNVRIPWQHVASLSADENVLLQGAESQTSPLT